MEEVYIEIPVITSDEKLIATADENIIVAFVPYESGDNNGNGDSGEGGGDMEGDNDNINKEKIVVW